jgi:hypothetical protein
LTLAAAGRARGQSASVVVINENGTVSTNASSGAAKWISPSAFVASSLETGPIGQIVAWGGNEYGYAYHYSLSGAPANVTIDADTGMLAIGTALAVKDYTFTVKVTNIEATGVTASFTFTLHVLQGITSGTPTTSQILHKTYDPGSGTWGTPSGNNWTNVFNAMQTAILADQVRCNAVHDESLRVTIPLQRGRTYQYTNNTWLNGIQYFQLIDHGSGALPILQNIISDAGGRDPYNDGPLNLGGGGGGRTGPGSIGHQEGIKARCARIATVAAGSITVTLLSSSDASKIKLNRWHLVCGKCLQIGGYPPNLEFIDYVKVTAVNGTTVTLDRPLKYSYDQTWWENPKDDQSLGVARLAPYDTGGTGGYIPTDRRVFIRARILNMNMLGNPNFPSGPNTNGANIVYMAGAISFTFEGCNIPNAQVTMSKHIIFKGCKGTWFWEPDKETETLLFDAGTNAGQVIGGTTGMQYVLFRNHHAGTINIAPRQLRSKGTLHDGTGDGSFPGTNGAHYGPPVTISFNGPLGYWDFGMDGACQFTHGMDSHFMFAGSADTSLVIGTNATWNGNQLRIPQSFASFQKWLIWTTAGTVLATNALPPYTANWGYVSSVTSPGDGSALWVNVVWVYGSKPTSGTLYLRRGRQLNFASGNTFNAGTLWQSPKFTKETATGCEIGWNFPSGYPANLSG